MSRFLMSALTIPCLALTLPGCTRQQDPPKQQPPKQEAAVSAADIQRVVQGNNQFAFELYARLAKRPGNTFFSPYSISTALAMTYAGARGNTAKEMAQTLHFTLDNDHLHPAFGQLIRQVQRPRERRNYELAVANSLWANKTDLALDAKFLRLAQTDYQAGVQSVDFIGDPIGARRTINGWIQDKTHNKIVDLIQPEQITKDTRLILANALYFQAAWSVPFPKEATGPEYFTGSSGSKFRVPTMKNTFIAPYLEEADFQLAQFMYKHDDLALVLILPKNLDGFAQVEKELSAQTLEQALARARATELQVALPKFKLTEELALRTDLERLGMHYAFLPKLADFQSMESKAHPLGSLYISEVMHQGLVAIDEIGTEAAAATAVVMSRPVSDQIKPLQLTPFRADHPFLFLIRHNATGSILFMGRVSDPRAT